MYVIVETAFPQGSVKLVRAGYIHEDNILWKMFFDILSRGIILLIMRKILFYQEKCDFTQSVIPWTESPWMRKKGNKDGLPKGVAILMYSLCINGCWKCFLSPCFHSIVLFLYNLTKAYFFTSL
jgi:hypothetical protein